MFFIVVIKHNDNKKLGERIYFIRELTGHTPLLKEVEAETQTGQEPKGRS